MSKERAKKEALFLIVAGCVWLGGLGLWGIFA